MRHQEIKALRQAGRLSEALTLAQETLANDPSSIWSKRAIAWVYFEFLKKQIESRAHEEVLQTLRQLDELQLPKEDTILFDSCAWKIGSYVMQLQNSVPVDYGKLSAIWKGVYNFPFSKPSAAYTFLYRSFHKGRENWVDFLDFADWWDLRHFLPEDFLPSTYQGRTIMALAEQAYIAYAKKLLAGEAAHKLQLIKQVNTVRVNSFLPKLDALIEEHPEYVYPPYFKARLLLTVGSGEEGLAAFLPFAKQKRRDFWVWDLLAALYPGDQDKQLACYCQALSLPTQDEFLIKVRENLTRILVARGLYNEAKTEISKMLATRERAAWKSSTLLTKWMAEPWYEKATGSSSNATFYRQYAEQAEELLFQDMPEELVVVEFVNANKQILNFVGDQENFGFFRYAGLVKKPKIGDVLRVRFAEKTEGGFHKP
ncbi:hypothetical protein A3SI_15423 [Nitritalea halalkaliphila LW7]|uniref:TOTE conflict systems S1/CSD-like domain-containing protein n=1 Tax=Nitritalea halalkaliphila LW7 TaxID=1189621 RepID=I5BYD6_9BACT|nr:hypothetical protein [Nitritalea halalkaliphila]EIM74588.1 hypothetical protein A3SI_15423 [Nitritalea halalkaliphila LW7]